MTDAREQAACFYKQGFKNKRQAQEIAQRSNRRRGDKSLTCYKCQYCKLIHIGTQQKF